MVVVGRPPGASDAETRRRMLRQRRANTKPERAVRALLTSLGQRFRLENRDLPGSPDLANRTHGWAIFVHGCFWHRHNGCAHATTPKRHRAFWLRKFEDNRRRDRAKVRELRRLGFQVLTIWECELAHSELLQRRVLSLQEAVKGRGSSACYTPRRTIRHARSANPRPKSEHARRRRQVR